MHREGIEGQCARRYGWTTANKLPAHEYIIPPIITLLPRGPGTVLDVGCGNGFLTSKLATQGFEVIGLDESEDGVALARASYPNIRFEVCSAYTDFRKLFGEVDIVVASEVIEHLYQPQRFLENAFHVLKPGGAIILTTPYHGYLKNLALSVLNQWDKHFTVHWEGGHIKFFSERTLSLMLSECGYRSITFRNAGRLRWLWKSIVCQAQKPRL